MVFAGGDGDCVNPDEAADRARTEKLSDLTKSEKVLEKQELEATRKGCNSVGVQNGRMGVWTDKVFEGYHETKRSLGRSLS